MNWSVERLHQVMIFHITKGLASKQFFILKWSNNIFRVTSTLQLKDEKDLKDSEVQSLQLFYAKVNSIVLDFKTKLLEKGGFLIAFNKKILL